MCRTPWSNFGSTGVGRCVICAERVGLISRRAWTVSRTGCDRRRVAVGWVFPGNFDWRAQHETPRLHCTRVSLSRAHTDLSGYASYPLINTPILHGRFFGASDTT